MVTRAKHIALLILFIALSLISISTIYYTHQLPTEEQRPITLCTYKHDGEYNCIAELKANTIYNQSTLKPSEGILYLRIINYICINLSYTFESQLSANTTIQYSINESVTGGRGWEKHFVLTPQTTINSTGTPLELPIINTLQINIIEVEQLVSDINQETGMYAADCNITISPNINTMAETTAGTINETFTPTLIISFKYRTEEGDHITIDGLQHTKTGAITRTEIIHQQWVMNQRYTSYIIFVVAFSGLAYTSWVFIKTKPTKPTKPERPIEELIEPYEEIIAEAKELSFRREIATIMMSSLEDLVKVADSLGKPILHSEEAQTHILYVLDGETKYEYTLITPIVEKEDNPQDRHRKESERD